MVERYVVYVTQYGDQEITRRMSQSSYIARRVVEALINFAFGIAFALLYIAK